MQSRQRWPAVIPTVSEEMDSIVTLIGIKTYLSVFFKDLKDCPYNYKLREVMEREYE